MGSLLAPLVPALRSLGSGQLPARAITDPQKHSLGRSPPWVGPLPAAELPVATLAALLLAPLKVSEEARALEMPFLEVLTALSWGSLLGLPLFGDLPVLRTPRTGRSGGLCWEKEDALWVGPSRAGASGGWVLRAALDADRCPLCSRPAARSASAASAPRAAPLAWPLRLLPERVPQPSASTSFSKKSTLGPRRALHPFVLDPLLKGPRSL